MSLLVTGTPAWSQLAAHAAATSKLHLRDLFAADPDRFNRFSRRLDDLLLDFSKQRITAETLTLLLELARAARLEERIAALLAGEPVNNTEGRAALHTALRRPQGTPFPNADDDKVPDVHEVLRRMYEFADSVRQGEWRGYGGKSIRTVVNIGIGGSDLGPMMVAHALEPRRGDGPAARFVSNLDGAALGRLLAELDPETTLLVIASKTFSTQETLTNATSARAWVTDHFGTDAAVARHFVAVSTAAERVSDFGIAPANMFGFWDWVGGRYSVWSAVGLSLIMSFGREVFEAFLSGAARLDAHFAAVPLEDNLPVLLGLIGIWNRNFLDAGTHAVVPYDYSLKDFAAYLQQLEMESNGKHVTRAGDDVDYNTCPVVWGGLGNNGQHAFYQLLHQGTALVSTDFLVAVNSQHATPDHQDAVLANAFAQSQALMHGRDPDQALAQSTAEGLDGDAAKLRARHRVMRGNQPSSTLVYDRLTPETLGMLIALYEHKVFVQSAIWDINAFDQWGVELGKQLAGVIEPQLKGADAPAEQDASTLGLIAHVRGRQ